MAEKQKWIITALCSKCWHRFKLFITKSTNCGGPSAPPPPPTSPFRTPACCSFAARCAPESVADLISLKMFASGWTAGEGGLKEFSLLNCPSSCAARFQFDSTTTARTTRTINSQQIICVINKLLCWQLFLAAHLFPLRRPIHIDAGRVLGQCDCQQHHHHHLPWLRHIIRPSSWFFFLAYCQGLPLPQLLHTTIMDNVVKALLSALCANCSVCASFLIVVSSLSLFLSLIVPLCHCTPLTHNRGIAS